ncbi:MAG: hypothetical protein G3M70_17575 [Candidatus Nitronauta litoralis]|uniref:Nitrile hydratase alpha /Thiocyanate hydrolase gamma domain-containing protein n=1 Tax=Candidatus Nitronauta litoralis TaxID=2705533 RepID=A0A7T0G1L8_9BACT|nr:MAG: hypothetical protein G3M70_17575 [Candidatus Nitronauta litoralis]
MKNVRKQELLEKWKKVATKAVTDDLFKEKLVKDPIGKMAEFDLTLPEEIEVLTGHANTITLVEPKDATENLKSEIKWWRVRLDVIQEFGQDERGGNAAVAGPAGDEDEDV